jgi:acetyl esterase
MAATDASTAADVLDPQILRFVQDIGRGFAAHPAFDRLSPPEARRVAEMVRAPWRQGGPSMHQTTEIAVPVGSVPLRVRMYDPSPSGPKPALIYLHGGGWTLFSIDTHDRVMREYAARAGVVVAGVDYPLSPEAKFPVALEQIVSLTRWLGEQGSEFNIDRFRLAIGGDSAGANLAVATCLTLRDAGEGSRVRAMLLSYGAFDAESSEEAARRFGAVGFPLSPAEMRGFWQNYIRGPEDIRNPLVCPLRASLEDLPAAFLTVPECDLLTEQSLAMADRLRKAGVPVRQELYRGATHSFLEAVSISDLAARALADGSRWLRETLA